MGGSVEFLETGAVSLAFVTRGRGPGLLVPWCNMPWPELPTIERLAERYRVVMAGPRGYQRSTRPTHSQEYSAATHVDDLLAVCDAVGLDEFFVLGYSLSAAITGWLTRITSRAQGVVVGGFPLLGSYASVLTSAEHDAEQLVGDPGFDPRAALAFYRDLAELPDGTLVDERRCPMTAFWGGDDAVLRGFNTEPDLEDALRARGVEVLVLDGADHLTAALDCGAIVDRAIQDM